MVIEEAGGGASLTESDFDTFLVYNSTATASDYFYFTTAGTIINNERVTSPADFYHVFTVLDGSGNSVQSDYKTFTLSPNITFYWGDFSVNPANTMGFTVDVYEIDEAFDNTLTVSEASALSKTLIETQTYTIKEDYALDEFQFLLDNIALTLDGVTGSGGSAQIDFGTRISKGASVGGTPLSAELIKSGVSYFGEDSTASGTITWDDPSVTETVTINYNGGTVTIDSLASGDQLIIDCYTFVNTWGPNPTEPYAVAIQSEQKRYGKDYEDSYGFLVQYKSISSTELAYCASTRSDNSTYIN